MFIQRLINSLLARIGLSWAENAEDHLLRVKLPKKIALRGNKKAEEKSGAENVEILPTPIKSESDRKEYQVIRLSNGLVATLISDAQNLIDLSSEDIDSVNKGRPVVRKLGKTRTKGSKEVVKEIKPKLAACALTVEVGSFSDPEDIQGLAHLLEHMIFMGSKKYPKENKLDAFLSKYGGFSNAQTLGEYTTFYFACPEKQLFKAMDIFAQLFANPLLKWNAIDRERESIESEFQQVFTDDDVKAEQILCSLATNDNPARKFTWGNQYSLRDVVKNKRLHEALKEFRKMHYSPDRMKLAVQGRLPLETLKNWVTACFSAIPKSPNNSHVFDPKQLFDMERFCRFYYVKSSEDVIELSISWILPSVSRKYKTKPSDYLGFIIGHEGRGSLLSFLKKKLWAVGLGAGCDSDLLSNDLYAVFSISLTLTDEGRAAIGKVLEATFSYLKMLRSNVPDKRLFDEIQLVARTGFRFQEEPEADDFVESVSISMRFYPPEDYLTGGSLLFEYNPEEIANFISRMSPSTVNIMLLAKSHEVKLDQEEFWFKTSYTSVPIPEENIRLWQNVDVYNDFTLPDKNPFITTDFSVLSHKMVPEYPKKIDMSDSVELWYKGDEKFKLPIASVGILLITPRIMVSPESNVMTSLFVDLLHHQLTEELYSAATASLNYDVSYSGIGMYLWAYGYNQHLGLLVERLALGLKNFYRNVDEKIFRVFQKRIIRRYYNSSLEPTFVASDILYKASTTPHYSCGEKYAAIQRVSLVEFLKHVDLLFERLHFQALIQGNLSEQDGKRIVSKVVDIIEPKGPLPKDQFPLVRGKILPNGEKCLKLQSFNVEDKNCHTTLYYQLGPGTMRDSVALELFVMIMLEPLFDKLRTKQQLGYEVSATAQETNGILGLSISVVSQVGKVPIQQVKQKIDDFLRGFMNSFPKMGNSDFLKFRQSLIDLKNSDDTSLYDEVGRNSVEIKKQEFVFDRIQKEIEIISKLDLKSVSTTVSKMVQPGSENFKKLVIQVVGNDTAGTEHKEGQSVEKGSLNDHKLPDGIVYNFLTSQNSPPGYFVTDLEEWEHGLSEYPPHKITQ